MSVPHHQHPQKVKSSRNKAEIQQQLRSVQSQMQAERDRRKRDEREENIKVGGVCECVSE